MMLALSIEEIYLPALNRTSALRYTAALRPTALNPCPSINCCCLLQLPYLYPLAPGP